MIPGRPARPQTVSLYRKQRGRGQTGPHFCRPASDEMLWRGDPDRRSEVICEKSEPDSLVTTEKHVCLSPGTGTEAGLVRAPRSTLRRVLQGCLDFVAKNSKKAKKVVDSLRGWGLYTPQQRGRRAAGDPEVRF